MKGRRGILALPLVALVLTCWLTIANADGDVSHAGWPHTVTTWFASQTGSTGIGTDGNDMLLGGPGSDHIYGGAGDNVIWGDRFPSPNGPNQTDWLYAGNGDNWFYTSHGTNHVFMGSGDNHIFAYFGRGTIDCGSGHDILTLSKSSYHHYTWNHCSVVQIGYP